MTIKEFSNSLTNYRIHKIGLDPETARILYKIKIEKNWFDFFTGTLFGVNKSVIEKYCQDNYGKPFSKIGDDYCVMLKCTELAKITISDFLECMQMDCHSASDSLASSLSDYGDKEKEGIETYIKMMKTKEKLIESLGYPLYNTFMSCEHNN